MLTGCKTTKQTTQQANVSSLQTMSVKYDSVFVEKFDSVFVKINGDTVFVERYKIDYRYKIKETTDTIIQRDSIYFDNYIEVEKKTSWWSNLKTIIVTLVVGMIIGFILAIIKKWR